MSPADRVCVLAFTVKYEGDDAAEIERRLRIKVPFGETLNDVLRVKLEELQRQLAYSEQWVRL